MEKEDAILVHLKYIREKLDAVCDHNEKQDDRCRTLHSKIDTDMSGVKVKTNIFMSIIGVILSGVVGLAFFIFERK